MLTRFLTSPINFMYWPRVCFLCFEIYCRKMLNFRFQKLPTTCTYRSQQHELNIGKYVEEATKPINSPRNKAKPSPKHTIHWYSGTTCKISFFSEWRTCNFKWRQYHLTPSQNKTCEVFQNLTQVLMLSFKKIFKTKADPIWWKFQRTCSIFLVALSIH